MHCCHPGHAVPGQQQRFVARTLRAPPGFRGELTHHFVVAAHEVIDELAAQHRVQREAIPILVAERACSAIGRTGLRSRIAVDRN